MSEKILTKLRTDNSIPFPDYLDLVLYDPTSGYYARSDSQVGRTGDFYTSVSVGPLFGRLLARRFLKWWEENGQPARWRILEIGAHDGKLAADILTTLRELSPTAWQSLEYAIPEPLPRLREAQKARIDDLAAKLLIRPSITEISSESLPGIAFGNEILDALPFHLVKMIDGNWQELHVRSEKNNELCFVPQPVLPDSDLSEKLRALGNGFPENYTTEIRTAFLPFLNAVSSCLTDGMLLFIDYGFAAPEYYDTQRVTGTLRTFSKHTAGENPLERPGEIDITAHVDFTDLTRAASANGYIPIEFSTQSSYLTHLAKPLILSGGLSDPKSISQFQSLTHPAHLGGKFHAIEFITPGESPPPVTHRLAL